MSNLDIKETKKIGDILRRLEAYDIREDSENLHFANIKNNILASKVGKYYRLRSNKARIYIPNNRVNIHYEAGVNPNGITAPDDIGITYSIGVDIRYNIRNYRCKYEYNDAFGFYFYTRTIEEFEVKFLYNYNKLIDSFLGDVYFFNN